MKKILVSLALGVASTVCVADSFPIRPVKIVLSVGIGSGPDVMARRIAEVLSAKWNQPVLVDNRPGGAGVIGLNFINSEAPNGYTIGFLDGGTVVSYAALYKNNEPIKQLEPIVPVLDANMALFASGQFSSFDTMKESIRKNPSYSSWNIGSVAHVLGAEFLSTLNVHGTHIVYKDFGQWQADISNRQVQFAFGSTGTIKNLVQAGKNQIFGIAAAQRDARYPNIPTIYELTGKKITTLIAWCGFYVPIAAPAAVKTVLEKDIRDAMTDRRVQETMQRFDYISLQHMSLKEFQQKIKHDQEQYTEMITKYKIEAQ